jgi:pimeloyl-ACP methyl ester carboxylesterase
MYTPAGLFFFVTKLTVPLAYIYIGAYVIRDIALRMDYLEYLTTTSSSSENGNGMYIPVLSGVLLRIEKFPLAVHIWCIIEAVFYVCLRLHIQWLQYKCPLEAALASAPMAEIEERHELFLRILECEKSDPTTFIEGWFFDAPLDTISRYDMLDFLSWCLYEGRRQEHLTEKEADQLRGFLHLLEYHISVHRYGLKPAFSNTVRRQQQQADIHEGEPSVSLLSGYDDGKNTNSNVSPRLHTSTSRDFLDYEDDVVEECDSITEEPSADGWSCEDLQKQHKLHRSASSNDVRWKYGPEPAKVFRFHVNDHGTTSTFFTALFETSRNVYNGGGIGGGGGGGEGASISNGIGVTNPATVFLENVNERVQNVNEFMEERVQDLRKFVHTKRQQIHSVEENARSTAQGMYQNFSELSEERMLLIKQYLGEMRQNFHEAETSAKHMASIMYDSVYFTLVEKGGSVDKSVLAFRQATALQLLDTWQGLKKRSSAASSAVAPSPEVVALRTKQLKQQLRNYRQLLNGMRDRSSTYSAKQMADLFHKISSTNEALWEAESIARNAFLRASGFAKQMMPSVPQGLGVGVTGGGSSASVIGFGQPHPQPLPYAKYSFDSIFDVAIYPLGFHLVILFATEGCLRIILHRKGFERRMVGQTAYYYHPGTHNTSEDFESSFDSDSSQASSTSSSRSQSHHSSSERTIPIVFCHGIGIGLIYYLQLIDMFLAQGRPLFLPELISVTAFRTWQSPTSALTPQAVASTMTSMLYESGFDQAVFVGHSYGSSWLSYMCKLAPQMVKGLVFLDPICFCLHLPFLTKQFVYQRADPGSTSYFVRTDVNVNWTIQRNFPWTRVALFVEQFPPGVQVAVFLSQNDTLVPTPNVSTYLQSKGAQLRHYPEGCHSQFYASNDVTLTIFGNVGHGDWAEDSDMSMAVSHAVDTLCCQVERAEETLQQQQQQQQYEHQNHHERTHGFRPAVVSSSYLSHNGYTNESESENEEDVLRQPPPYVPTLSHPNGNRAMASSDSTSHNMIMMSKTKTT